MKKITQYKPDVNSSVFNLIYENGVLEKIELVKVDPIHEGMTAEQAFEHTRNDCIQKTNLIVEIESALKADKATGSFDVSFDENRELKVTTDDELKDYLLSKGYPIKQNRL